MTRSKSCYSYTRIFIYCLLFILIIFSSVSLYFCLDNCLSYLTWLCSMIASHVVEISISLRLYSLPLVCARLKYEQDLVVNLEYEKTKMVALCEQEAKQINRLKEVLEIVKQYVLCFYQNCVASYVEFNITDFLLISC